MKDRSLCGLLILAIILGLACNVALIKKMEATSAKVKKDGVHLFIRSQSDNSVDELKVKLSTNTSNKAVEKNTEAKSNNNCDSENSEDKIGIKLIRLGE